MGRELRARVGLQRAHTGSLPTPIGLYGGNVRRLGAVATDQAQAPAGTGHARGAGRTRLKTVLGGGH